MNLGTLISINAFNLLALLFNSALALVSLVLSFAARPLSIFRSLCAFYVFSSLFFLGLYLYPLQGNTEAIIFWHRVMLLGIVWLPTGWAWVAHELTGKKLRWLIRINLTLGAFFSLALIFINHPAIISAPVSYMPLLKAYRPQAYLSGPVIFTFTLLSTFFSLYILALKRRKELSSPLLTRPVVISTGLLFLIIVHDALVAMGIIRAPLGILLSWSGSIVFSFSLVVAVAAYLKGIAQRLIDNENRFRVLVESSHDPILSMDIDRTILECNPAIEKLLGYTSQEIKGHSPRILHLSEEKFREFGREVYPQVPEMGSWRGRWPYRHKNGTTVISETVVSAIRGDNGQITGYLAIHRDETDKAKVEQRLKQQNKYLEALHQTTVGLIEKTDPDSLLLSIVTRACELMAAPHGWIVTLNESGDRLISRYGVGVYEDLIGNELKKGEGVSGLAWEQNRRVVIDSFEPFPHPAREHLENLSVMAGIPLYSGADFVGVLGVGREKGEPRFTEEETEQLSRFAQLASIILANAKSYALLSQELAERKKAEAALRESEQRYRDLFDSVSDLIYTQDLEGRFITLNQAVAKSFGYPREYFIGKTPKAFMRPETIDYFETEYLNQLKTKGEYQGVTLYFNRAGEQVFIEYKSVLVRPREGQAYISGVGRDVTERVLTAKKLKGLQAQLTQSQKLEAVGTLAGGVAHDFNNILQAFSGYLDLMETESRSTPRLEGHLQDIRQVLDRAAELVRRLMTFSRKEKFALVPVQLNREITATVKIIERIIPRMISITTDLEPDLALIKGDPSQLEQILMNLGINAKDAMPDGGLLSIKTRNISPNQDFAEQHLEGRAGDYVELTVSDTGRGMDPQTMSHIYEPFFTTKGVGRGTGLGLSSVYGIIKEYGGYIYCDSLPGKGTIFKIYLPVLQEGIILEEKKHPDMALSSGGTETLLVVDDEDAVRALSKDLLGAHGYQVYLAPNGEEALRVYQQKGEEIDLVILDLGMPGMGGFKCLERLLALDPKARVIVASGYNDRRQIREVDRAGAKGFLGKPYRLGSLLAKVREVLDATGEEVAENST